jgi:D-cysteine desulfhydrase
MDAGFGAELRWVGRMELVPLGMLRARRAHRADQPFVIAPGGSDPVGTIGYVNAALELAEQIENDRIARPSRVHVAAGTLGTAAGLAVGFAMAGLDLPITATRISRRIVTNLPALRGLVRGASELLRKAGASVPSENRALRLVRIAHRQFGRGYGEETEAGREAVRIFAALGLRLDPTYTAKAAAELMMSSDEDDAPPLFLLTLSAAEPMDRARAIRPADLPAKFAEYLAQPPAQTSD